MKAIVIDIRYRYNIYDQLLIIIFRGQDIYMYYVYGPAWARANDACVYYLNYLSLSAQGRGACKFERV